MSDADIWARALVAVIACTSALWLAGREAPQRWDARRFDRVALGAILASRILIFVAIFVVAGAAPRSDVTVYHQWSAYTLEGRLAGTESSFPMHYGPFFLFLTSLPVLVWDSPKSIIALMVAAEAISIPLWIRIGRVLADESTVRRATILYALCPISFLTAAVTGNNDVLVSLGLAAALLLLLRRRDAASGAAAALTALASKALILLAAPVLWAYAASRWLWSAALLVPMVLVYVLWAMLGADFLGGLGSHVQHFTSGNLPFALSMMEGMIAKGDLRNALNAVALLVLAAVFLRSGQRGAWGHAENAAPLVVLVFAVFMLFSGKTFPHYWVIVLFPMMIVLSAGGVERRMATAFVIFGLVTAVESSMWYRWLRNAPLSELHSQGLHPARQAAFIVTEAAMLGVYAYIAVLCVSRLRVRASVIRP